MRRSRCFVFDLSLNLRDSNSSKPKRTVTPYMYICLPNLCPSRLSVWNRLCKNNTFNLKTTLFG